MIKQQKLILEYDYDFMLAGVVSPVKEYKLAWHINQVLQIDLRKEDDLEYLFLKDCKILISNFIFETEYSSFRLLKNRSVEFLNTTKPYLLPELKNYDYFIMLSGEFAAYYNEYITKLNEIQVIQLIRMIEVINLPSKENLLIY